MAHVSFPVWITLLLVAWPPCFFGVLHPPHRGFCTALDLSPKHSEVAAAAVLQHRVLKHRKQGRLLDKIEVSLQSEPSEMFRDIFWFNVYVGKDRIRMHADIYYRYIYGYKHTVYHNFRNFKISYGFKSQTTTLT